MKEVKKIEEKAALQKAARYCSISEHCISEVQEKLISWKMLPEEQERILSYLIKENYVDEDRYCHAFIHDKITNNKWGRVKISYILRQKGIASSLINKHLSEINFDQYKDILRTLLNSRCRSTKSANKFELKNKLIRFALGRGFEIDVIQECLNNLQDEE